MTAIAKPVRFAGIKIWLGRLLLAALALWLTADLLRTGIFSVGAWGLARGLTDAVFIFRVGEALVVLALSATLLAAGRASPVARWLRWAVWAGALLAGLSFLGLNGRVAWAPLALIVAALGSLLPLLGGRRGAVWLALAGLVLLHLAGYAAGFLFHGYAVAPYPAAPPRPAASRDERWQQDIAYLGDELARLHKNAFHTVPANHYWAEIDRLQAAVPGLEDGQIAVELMRLVASVGDGHTGFLTRGQVTLHGLPVDLRWYSDGLYVRGIDPAYPLALGARVVKIGALTAEQAYQAVLPYISHENDPWARLQSANYLNLVEVLRAAGAVATLGPVPFTLEDPSGRSLEVDIAPLGPGQTVEFLSAIETRAYYRSRPDEPFWFDYRETSGTLYFRYAACVDMLAFRSLMRELWRLVDERPVERLIVDLRGNGGGNSMQLEWFFMPGLRAHPALDHPERFFVLIDRGTFSSASDNAAFLQMNTRATLAGEPTGGKPNGYGEVRQFDLPNSHTRVSYSTKYFRTVPGDPPSVAPDLPIDMPAQAAFSGRDPLLETLVPAERWPATP